MQLNSPCWPPWPCPLPDILNCLLVARSLWKRENKMITLALLPAGSWLKRRPEPQPVGRTNKTLRCGAKDTQFILNYHKMADKKGGTSERQQERSPKVLLLLLGWPSVALFCSRPLTVVAGFTWGGHGPVSYSAVLLP